MRRAPLAAALTALSLATLGPLAPAAPATQSPAVTTVQSGPACDESQPPGEAPPYEGRSVSRLYDGVFSSGPAIPYLNERVPQGLTTWPNWDGKGHTLLLLGMYRPSDDSYLVGIDPDSGRTVGAVRIDESHLGGIGVLGDWLITQSDPESGGQAVRRYSLERLRTKMRDAVLFDYVPHLNAVGDPQPVDGASFMDVADGSLWMGRYSRFTPAEMFRYAVDNAGTLRRTGGPWPVPPRSQGLLVTPTHVLIASSDGTNHGQLRAYRRSAEPEADPIGCLWTPSLPQNLTLDHGRVFAAYESGAAYFLSRPGFLNRIGHLHTADLAALLQVMDPGARDTMTGSSWSTPWRAPRARQEPHP
jgi:hypothetical protein